MAALAALLATAWGRTAALLWAAGVIAIAGGAAWWASMSWRRVTVDAWFEPARAFIGEPTFLAIRVENAKPRRLPIVRISVRLPDGLDQVPDPEPTTFHGHRVRTQVAGGAETVLRFPVHPQHRGEFWLDRVDVELSDPFDLAPVRREIAVERPLLVMPSPRGGVPLRMRRWLPFGAPMPAARLFEDSEHFAGVRDYEPGDPMHHVHWRLSAHAGALQTKTYEPTRSAEVVFALDLSDGEPFWERADASLAEETIGMASYLARQAIHAGWRAGLVANTHLRRGRGPLRVTAASSAGPGVRPVHGARAHAEPADGRPRAHPPRGRETADAADHRGGALGEPRPGSDPRDGAPAPPRIRRHPRGAGRPGRRVRRRPHDAIDRDTGR